MCTLISVVKCIFMCTYEFIVFGAKTLEIILISDYQAHELLLQIFSVNFLTHTYNTKSRTTN